MATPPSSSAPPASPRGAGWGAGLPFSLTMSLNPAPMSLSFPLGCLARLLPFADTCFLGCYIFKGVMVLLLKAPDSSESLRLQLRESMLTLSPSAPHLP